jgi:hypothetical protein
MIRPGPRQIARMRARAAASPSDPSCDMVEQIRVWYATRRLRARAHYSVRKFAAMRSHNLDLIQDL